MFTIPGPYPGHSPDSTHSANMLSSGPISLSPASKSLSLSPVDDGLPRLAGFHNDKRVVPVLEAERLKAHPLERSLQVVAQVVDDFTECPLGSVSGGLEVAVRT